MFAEVYKKNYYGWSLQKKLLAIELSFAGVYFTDQKEKPSIIIYDRF